MVGIFCNVLKIYMIIVHGKRHIKFFMFSLTSIVKIINSIFQNQKNIAGHTYVTSISIFCIWFYALNMGNTDIFTTYDVVIS